MYWRLFAKSYKNIIDILSNIFSQYFIIQFFRRVFFNNDILIMITNSNKIKSMGQFIFKLNFYFKLFKFNNSIFILNPFQIIYLFHAVLIHFQSNKLNNTLMCMLISFFINFSGWQIDRVLYQFEWMAFNQWREHLR
jgi:hypothetical protein